jgi:nucleoprotein TPR
MGWNGGSSRNEEIGVWSDSRCLLVDFSSSYYSRLTKSNAEYTEKLVKMETEAKLGDSEVVPLKFQVDRLKTEIDSMATQNTWLDSQLKAQTEQLAQVRTSHASEMAALRSELSESREDQAESEAEVSRLQRQGHTLESRNDRLSKELRESKMSAADQTADAEDELQQTRSLVNMQRNQLDLLQSKHDSLATQLEAVKNHALQAEQQSNQGLLVRQQELERKSKQILQHQAEAFQQQAAELQSELAKANRRLKDAEDGLLLTNTPSSRRSITAGGTPGRSLAIQAQAVRTTDDEPLNLTDLYGRLAETEDALASETLRRKKTEILLERIKADIEASAPTYIRQRHEFEDALERQEEYRKRLDAALDEARATREESQDYQVELGRLQARNKDLEAETTELAKQVQTLLVSRSSAGTFGFGGGGATSTTPPAPSAAVVQMQSTNQKLSTQVRKMAGTIKELEEKLKEDTLRHQVETYEQDLVALREERKRQEVMVESIVQQRDLYRALLAKQDSQLLGSPTEEASMLQIVKKQSERAKVLEQEKNKLDMDLAKARGELDAVDRDKEAASERLARYEALNEELTKTVDRLQGEVSRAKADVARGGAEVDFYRDKTARLEESLERSRNEASRVSASKSDLQRINADLQDALSKTNADAGRFESELQHAQMKLRLAESQVEQAKAAEQRLANESSQLRGEISRQGALIESIQRIEASLSSKAASEEEYFKSQIISLTEKLSAAESKNSLQVENLSGKVTDQEVLIKDLQQSREQAAKEALESKKETLKVTTELHLANKKVTLLEAQLRAAKKKLGETGEDQDIEGELRGKVTSLTEELEAARKETATMKERAATYEKLAKENEAAVAEQTKASATVKQAHDEEISALQGQLEAATTESTKSKEVITELMTDLAAQRGDRAKELEDVNKRITELEDHAEKYQKDAESSQNRYSQLESEVVVLRTDVVTAETNYERELSLHSAAMGDLRSAKEEAEAESRLRKMAEEQDATAKSELEEGRSFLEHEKKTMENTVKEFENNLKETRAQNTLLHGQLEKINDQIEKIQSGTGGALDSSTSEGATDEVNTLQKTISELREVVKFVRADKEMVQSQLDSARRAAERERAAAAVAKRSLEEARAELKVFQESAGSADSGSALDGLKEKLKNAEQQARLLSESNSHLREEVKKLETNLAAVKKELESSNSASIPSEKRLQNMETEKAGLIAEKESLLREIEDWKGRVQSLVSKFNQVDPAEHAILVKKAEALGAQVKSLESQKLSAQEESKRIRALASRASKELMQNKTLVETHKKTIVTLTAEKEAWEKAQKDGASKKELTEAKEKLTKLEGERASEKVQLTGAQEMNDKLRERLRQFQKMIMEMKKKEAALAKDLKDTKDDLEKQKQAPAATVPKVESKKASPPAETKAPEKDSAESEKTIPVPPKEATKEAAPAPTATKPSVPAVPPGGFKFAPSAPKESKTLATAKTDAAAPKPTSADSSTKPAVPVEPAKPSNKRPADAPEDAAEAKKAKPQEVAEDANETAPEQALGGNQGTDDPVDAVKSSAQRRGSGETKELSMKEKLLEKKRKLMLAMQKKKGLMEKEAAAKEEPASKKAKVEEAPPLEQSVSKESAVSEVSEIEGKEQDDIEDGEAEPAAEKDTGEASEETPTWGSAPAAAPVALNPSAVPFKPPTTSGSTQPAFGSSTTTTTGGFGQKGLGSGFGQRTGQSSAFGQASGFGSASSGGSFFGAKSTTTGTTGASSSGFGGSSSFLNMKPPGSSTTAPTFTFGSSSSITLPTPSNPSPQANMFSAFSSQNQAPAFSAKPLFSVKKEEAKDDEDKEEGEEGEMEETEQPQEPES